MSVTATGLGKCSYFVSAPKKLGDADAPSGDVRTPDVMISDWYPWRLNVKRNSSSLLTVIKQGVTQDGPAIGFPCAGSIDRGTWSNVGQGAPPHFGMTVLVTVAPGGSEARCSSSVVSRRITDAQPLTLAAQTTVQKNRARTWSAPIFPLTLPSFRFQATQHICRPIVHKGQRIMMSLISNA